MLRKVCFISMKNRYGSQRIFAQEFIAALERAGIRFFHIDVGEEAMLSDEGIASIHQHDPDLIISFCNILPCSDGRYLGDILAIPHLSILTDPLIWFMALVKSQYSLVACVDRYDVEMLKKMGSERVLFFPHAVDRSLFELPLDQPRPYEVTFVGTCFDYESIEEMWKEKWEPHLYRLAMAIFEIYKSGQKVYLPAAALQLARDSGIDPADFNLKEFCYRVDNFVRGWDRVQMLRAAALEHPLHIFGTNILYYPMYRGWDYYLKDLPNVHLHDPIPFHEVAAIIQKSRVLLNSSPFFYDGSHERIFYGLTLGTSVVTTVNSYIEEQFGRDKGVDYYRVGSWEMIIPALHHFLEDEPKRLEEALRGREIVREHHTWDSRVKTLIEHFPDLYCQVFTGDALSLEF